MKPIASIKKETLFGTIIAFEFKNGKKISVYAVGRGPMRSKHMPVPEKLRLSYRR